MQALAAVMRRHAVAAHQQLRRGAGAAVAAGGGDRAAHAADHRLRVGRRPGRRPHGGLVPRGAPDAAPHRGEPRAHRAAWTSSAAPCPRSSPASTSARSRSPRTVISSSSNRARASSSASTGSRRHRSATWRSCASARTSRRRRSARLRRVRGERNQADVDRALDGGAACRRGHREPASGDARRTRCAQHCRRGVRRAPRRVRCVPAVGGRVAAVRVSHVARANRKDEETSPSSATERKINILRKRRYDAIHRGGAAGRAQHPKGKLTARERIGRLLDPGTVHRDRHVRRAPHHQLRHGGAPHRGRRRGHRVGHRSTAARCSCSATTPRFSAARWARSSPRRSPRSWTWRSVRAAPASASTTREARASRKASSRSPAMPRSSIATSSPAG